MSIPGDWPCSDATDPVNCPGKSLRLNHPMDLVFKSDGSFFLAAWHNHKVEDYNAATGTVSIIAGQSSPGFIGDGGPAEDAKMNFPDSAVPDSAGNLLVSDERSNRVRRISGTDRTIITVVGANNPPVTSGYSGDNDPATAALLAIAPYNEAGGADNPPPGGGLALDANGNLYLADTYNNCIRKVAPGSDGIIGDGDPAEEAITTLAGSCGELTIGYNGDGGPALSAAFNHPHDLDFGPDGRLYLTDSGNHVVRAIDLTTGIVTTVAGTGTAGFSGDGGPATAAQLREPYGIAFDAAGNFYIVDTLNNRIRIVAQ
jgi:sugar lactone lactonase YvrE